MMRACCGLLFVLAAGGALTACTTTTTGGPVSKKSPELAAKYNAQLASGYMREGRMDLARQKLADALKEAPHLAVVRNTLALYYTRLAEYGKAEKQYKLSLEYKPGDPDTLNNYGVFLCSHGKPRASIKYFTQAAGDLDYNTPDSALANAGLCAQKIPDDKLATQYFRRALAVNPNQSQALWQLGLMAFTQGRYSQANGYLSHLIDIQARPAARVLWVAIETNWTLGRARQAKKYGRQLLTEYPGSPEAKKFVQLLSHSK
ncbi:MAG: type IV pilus biogenesis/stability protein PilW [Gammaproteobacteria bacterium]